MVPTEIIARTVNIIKNKGVTRKCWERFRHLLIQKSSLFISSTIQDDRKSSLNVASSFTVKEYSRPDFRTSIRERSMEMTISFFKYRVNI